MKYSHLIIGLFLTALFSFHWVKQQNDLTVSQFLIIKGEKEPSHHRNSISEELITQGKELVNIGKTTYNGKKSKKISKYFTCTSCHNTVKETEDVKDGNDPVKRLSYSYDNKLPFLQGSTFYGIVNRETWYNDDYKKKYGDLVDSARNDLVASIQLCAQECSQGRVLETWEEEAILAYLWSLEVKISDLNLPSSLSDSLKNNSNSVAVERIKDFYLTNSPAHFITPDEEKPYLDKLTGDYDNGKKIYDLSCKSCHKRNGVSLLVLDDSKPTKKSFQNNLGSFKNSDLYQIVRWGTYPVAGHKPYMPLYPKEKMSIQQLKDLVTYLTTIK